MTARLGFDDLMRNNQPLTLFNIGGLCDDIAHAGRAAPLPMVVRPGIFSRDERGCRLIRQESSGKNEASGTRAESPSPRLSAIQTLLTATRVPAPSGCIAPMSGPVHPSSVSQCTCVEEHGCHETLERIVGERGLL